MEKGGWMVEVDFTNIASSSSWYQNLVKYC